MSVLHPHLSASVRAMVARIGRAAIPDDEPGCCGECDQGRRQCPTPDACCISDEEVSASINSAITTGVCALILVLMLAALVMGWLP